MLISDLVISIDLEQGEKIQTFREYSVIRDIVLKVLKAQGIPNPSDEVIDNAIKEHLNQKVNMYTKCTCTTLILVKKPRQLT